MDGVQARFHAGQLHIMATDEGIHPARKWAAITAKLILAPSKIATIEAIAEVYNLRQKIEDELVGVFEEAKVATSASEIVIITSQASGRIIDIASGTKWAMEFAATPTRAAMEELIMRNLASATNIALRTE